MQTIGTIEFAWNIDIRVCVECRHSGMRGMQTFGYTWNADIRVCERGLQVSGSMNSVRGKKVVVSSFKTGRWAHSLLNLKTV